jgi:ferric-dicitrate binding protein FerR (iron transport regulator)
MNRNANQRRPLILAIPVSSEEKAEIQRAARADERHTATFARMLILRTIRESVPDVVAAQRFLDNPAQPQRRRARLAE